MSTIPRQVIRREVSGREIYICDHFIDVSAAISVMQWLNSLHYSRRERSRAGTEVSGSAANISDAMASTEPIFEALTDFAKQMFSGERFLRQRLYVNKTVYGDMYYPHRDCEPDLRDVTVLYYANPIWKRDWAGETVFYDEDEGLDLAVAPRCGRVVAFRGSILHCGGVPSRICYLERLTVATKLRALD